MAKEHRYYTLSDKEKVSVIKKIKEVLAEEEVDLAIIFGSFIELNNFRDIDIAIHAKGRMDIDKIAVLTNKLEEVLKIPIHIVPIDKVNPSFRLSILKRGLIVLEKPGIYEALFMQTIDELALLTKY